MAGPLVFWPNRKSKHGLQASSKTPRSHKKPFVTKPPVMKLTSLLAPKKKYDSFDCLDDAELIDSFKADLERLLPAYSDVLGFLLKLVRLQREQLEIHKQKDEVYKTVSKTLDEAETELKRFEQIEKQHADLKTECETKTADLRKLRDQLDEDKIQLRVLYAIDEACAARDAELRTRGAEIAELKSRVAELEASKKKLREAMARLAEKT